MIEHLTDARGLLLRYHQMKKRSRIGERFSKLKALRSSTARRQAKKSKHSRMPILSRDREGAELSVS
jgi:hypothetical protein